MSSAECKNPELFAGAQFKVFVCSFLFFFFVCFSPFAPWIGKGRDLFQFRFLAPQVPG
jgi:hypothetical protein